MKTAPLPTPLSLPLLLALALALMPELPGGAARAASYVTIEAGEDGRYVVEFGGRHFATVETQGHPKPIIYPITGPGGVRMTRDFPMVKGTAGEASDHPHHQSLWYTHGDVNGTDFWAMGKGSIVTTKVEKPVNSGSSAWLVLHNKWVDADGKTVLTDVTKLTFHKEVANAAGVESSAIDFEITLQASEGEVTFGDTKEGTMGIRTNPALRIDKGATAINSEGVSGEGIWGKRAKWVDYSATVDGKAVGVSIFDHPTNPRHPTWWHARAYGLVAANPFGVKDFEKKPHAEGEFKIAKDASATFKYRFVFHQGDAEKAEVGAQFDRWAEK